MSIEAGSEQLKKLNRHRDTTRKTSPLHFEARWHASVTNVALSYAQNSYPPNMVQSIPV